MPYQQIKNIDAKNFTPARLVPKVFGGPRTIDAITIHHWGAMGQNFMGVVNYLASKNDRDSSAHEVIESGRVAIIVNHGDAAWHAGNSTGNRTTIGLELRPEATGGDYETAAERIADIRAYYKRDLPLVPHKYWKNTACPGRWDLDRLDRMARSIQGSVKPVPAPKPSYTFPTFRRGMTDKRIANLKQDMLKMFPSYFKGLLVTPYFGSGMESRVKEFQRRVNIVADGVVGPQTWGELAKYGIDPR